MIEFSLIEVGECNFTIKEFHQRFSSVNFDIGLWGFTSILKAITPANICLDEDEYIQLHGHTSSEDVFKTPSEVFRKTSQVLVFHFSHLLVATYGGVFRTKDNISLLELDQTSTMKLFFAKIHNVFKLFSQKKAPSQTFY